MTPKILKKFIFSFFFRKSNALYSKVFGKPYALVSYIILQILTFSTKFWKDKIPFPQPTRQPVFCIFISFYHFDEI